MEWMKEKKERKVFKWKEELNEDFQIFIEQRSIYKWFIIAGKLIVILKTKKFNFFNDWKKERIINNQN